MNKLLFWLTVILSVVFYFPAQADEYIDMSEVHKLAKLPVGNILQDTPIEIFNIQDYWSSVQGRSKPLVVFFYSNIDGPSQRLATLFKYIAPAYSNKLSFGRVEVADKGKPNPEMAREMASKFSLDKTPGILFYDNVGADMVLDDEDYIDPDFKEFRTPRMLLWKTYYSAVRKELDKLLAD